MEITLAQLFAQLIEAAVSLRQDYTDDQMSHTVILPAEQTFRLPDGRRYIQVIVMEAGEDTFNREVD